jgi:hypothetical protein
VMTMHEQKLAQLQAQEAGRNTRFDQSQEARRRREQEIDRRILEKRTKTTDGAGVTLTAKERDAAAAERRRVGQEEAITSGNEVPAGTDIEGGPWTGPALATERLGTLRAERDYQATREREAKVGGKTAVDFQGTNDELDRVWKDELKKPMEELTPPVRERLTTIAGGIAVGNSIPPSSAIKLAMTAIDPKAPIRFMTDTAGGTRVQIGRNPPIRIGEDALNMIALARGGTLTGGPAVETSHESYPKGKGSPRPRATTALPGVTGNPTPAQRRRRALDEDMLESGMLNPMYRP